MHLSLSLFLASLWAHPKPPPTLIPACISVPGKKKTQSHKHARLGQSWFHNHPMTALLYSSISFFLSFCLFCTFFLSCLSFTPPSPLSALQSSILYHTLPCLSFSSYVLYLHTLSPTLEGPAVPLNFTSPALLAFPSPFLLIWTFSF